MDKTISLVKVGNTWVIDKGETQHRFTFDLDSDTSWVSLGIHPDSGVRFECTQNGVLERAYRVVDNVELELVVLPSNHGLVRQLNILEAVA